MQNRLLLLETAGSQFTQSDFLCQSVSPLAERERYTLGSLSHLLSHPARGYVPLPEFPTVASDPSLREVKVEAPPPRPAFLAPKAAAAKAAAKADKSGKGGKKAANFDPDHFYSDVDEESGSDRSDRSGNSDDESDRSDDSRSDNSDDSRSRSSSRYAAPFLLGPWTSAHQHDCLLLFVSSHSDESVMFSIADLILRRRHAVAAVVVAVALPPARAPHLAPAAAPAAAPLPARARLPSPSHAAAAAPRPARRPAPARLPPRLRSTRWTP